MEAKVKELVGKLRVLEFAVQRSQEIIETNSSDAISRHESAIVTKIQACHTLKNTIEEEIKGSRKRNLRRKLPTGQVVSRRN